MKTVALVGFSNLTMPFIKQSKADEIWTLNHAYRVIGKYLPRIDRLFELHSVDWFRRKEIKAGTEYWDWLREKHDFPIYMQEVMPEIPSSEKFPIDEIKADLFSGFKRGDEMVTYLTSSVALMLAYAIYIKVDRIEMYGVEMQTGTEYSYQKASGEFMIGLALGRGIEVQLLPESSLCRGLLYGYTANPAISRERMEYYHNYYSEEAQKKFDDMILARDTWNAYATGGNVEEAQAKKLFGEFNTKNGIASSYAGARNLVKQLMEDSDYWIGRQNLEGKSGQYRKELEKWKAETNYRRALFNAYTKLPARDLKEERKLWQEYTEANLNMYSLSGSLQTIEKFIDESDLQEVNPELGNKMVMEDVLKK